MTHDERHQQLMNQELDGTNPPAASAELAQLLAADPALQEEFERLREAVDDLEAVELEVPPRSLWPAVAREIAADREPVAAIRREAPVTRRWWRPQLAWAFCTGLAVGLLALIVATRDDVRLTPRGFEQPYGSLAVAPSLTQPLAGSPWQAAGVTVTAGSDGDLVELTVDHDVADPVIVTIGARAGQACVGWQDLGGGLPATIVEVGTCVLQGSGSGRTRVWFRPASTGPGQLQLRVHAADGQTHGAVLGDPVTPDNPDNPDRGG